MTAIEGSVPGTFEPLDWLPSELPGVERKAALPLGFAAGAMAAGIKASGRPDLAVVRTTHGPAAAAAVYTQQPFAAAPVQLSRAHLAASAPDGQGGFGLAEAIVATSGCANAATGEPGLDDQREVGRLLAAATGVPAERILHLSTGIIGSRLPIAVVAAGLAALVPAGLIGRPRPASRPSPSRFGRPTRGPSWPATEIALPDIDGFAVRSVSVTGCAKGVGMIHPGMATMLSVILTDAAIEPAVLHGLLRPAAARTWNQLTVDGDTSTNDTVFVLASGAAGTAPVRPGSDAARQLGRAIEAVARDLARQQAADGEGATTLLTCQVSGRDRRGRGSSRCPVGGCQLTGQGGSPRAGSELGPDRRGGRQRPAGRSAGARGGRTEPGGGRRAGRPAGQPRPGPAPDLDRRAGRLRRQCRWTAGLRPGGRPGRDGRARDPHPARPGPRLGQRRGIRLRPDRGIRDRERRVHHVTACDE